MAAFRRVHRVHRKLEAKGARKKEQESVMHIHAELIGHRLS